MIEQHNSAQVAAAYEAAYPRTEVGETEELIIRMFLLHRMGGLSHPVNLDYSLTSTHLEPEPEVTGSLALLELTDSEIAMSQVQVEDESSVFRAYELLGLLQRELNNTDRVTFTQQIENIIGELASKQAQLKADQQTESVTQYQKVINKLTNLLSAINARW